MDSSMVLGADLRMRSLACFAVLLVAILSASVSAQSIDKVELIPEAGSASIFVEGSAVCRATSTPADAAKSFRFFRLAKSGLRFDEVGNSSDVFDCSNKCSDGDKVACAAYSSEVPPPAQAPCEPVCSLAPYLGCEGSEISASFNMSQFIPVTESCWFTTAVRTQGQRSHDIACVRDDPTSLSSKFIVKECAGDDDPIADKDFALVGASERIGLRIETSMLSSDLPREISTGEVISAASGAISVDLRPTWAGDDGRAHRFFHYFVDDANQIVLEKSSEGKMACSFKVDGSTYGANVPILDWSANSNHRLLMQWNVSGNWLNCSVDDVSSKVQLPKAIALGSASPKFTIGGAGGMKAESAATYRFWRSPFPQTAYCTSDERWAFDLDSKDKASCSYARLGWTGTKCCGEFNDRPEFYNDPIPPPESKRYCVPGSRSCEGSKLMVCGFNFNWTVLQDCANGCSVTEGDASCSPCPPCGAGQTCDPATGMCGSEGLTGMAVAGSRLTGFAVGDSSRGVEYAYDAAIQGVCWNSSVLPNGRLAPGTGNKVLAAMGRLFACGLAQNDPLLALKDDHQQSLPLITSVSHCALAHDIGGNSALNLYCSPRTNAWIETSSNVNLALSFSPTDPQDSGCCAAGSACWDGTQCVPDQLLESEMRLTQGFRCIQGRWVEAVPKVTPDRSGKGFCPQKQDCLINPQGSPLKNYMPDECFSGGASYLSGIACSVQGPSCLSDRQFFLDDFCLEGNWSSRTKVIALELLDIALRISPSDYALFCGEYSDVLTAIADSTLGAGSIQDYLGQSCQVSGATVPCVNNFCALRFQGNKVAFGTSINIAVDDPNKSFLLALGRQASDCSNAAARDGWFHQCASGGSSSPQVYYNSALKAVVVTPAGVLLRAAPQAPAYEVSAVLKNASDPVISLKKRALVDFFDKPATKVFVDPLVNSTRMDNVFVFEGADRTYFGFLQKDTMFDFGSENARFGEFVDVASIAYDGITVSDPTTNKAACDLITDRIQPSKLKEYSCVYSGTSLRMAALERTPASGAAETPIRTFWRDLTSKLR